MALRDGARKHRVAGRHRSRQALAGHDRDIEIGAGPSAMVPRRRGTRSPARDQYRHPGLDGIRGQDLDAAVGPHDRGTMGFQHQQALDGATRTGPDPEIEIAGRPAARTGGSPPLSK
jgi:hypothetical protein